MSTARAQPSPQTGLNDRDLWRRYGQYLCADPGQGFSLDISRVRFDDDYLDRMEPVMAKAFQAMRGLEAGGIANQDEQRMVGHYWLREPGLAPAKEIGDAIGKTLTAILEFARQVHEGTIEGSAGPFKHLVHIGIGGSALGPQFVSQALGGAKDKMALHFMDNTDPDGIDGLLEQLRPVLGQTLVTVVSKSGGTPEPRNGMVETKAAFERAGLSFARHAVAVTMDGSQLDQTAKEAGWLKRFSMWDWVGGRTSVMSAVGLVPLALLGVDVERFLEGAAAMDRLTRVEGLRKNPAALLALMWFKLGNGRGEKDMVVLPYKDRLMMFSRYLQQLVMESIGKQLDRAGAEVHQGIAVYGNKGSTDQHAYVQQLREGVPNFFVVFIQVLMDRDTPSIEVEPGTTSGDYLFGFLQGTRKALFENGRDSITITIDQISSASVGALIALFDRTVGLYAELVNINAYHQPGVEAGKKAAADVLELQKVVLGHLKSVGDAQTADQIAKAVGQADEAETIFKVLEHQAANPGSRILMHPEDSPECVTFRVE